jgi:rSAM/selenodomain-associated transferase 1
VEPTVNAETGGGRVLIVVAKAPRPGHVKTRLATSLAPEAIVALYRCLIEDTLELARSLPDTRVTVVCPSGDVEDLRAWLGTSVEIVAQQGHGLAAALDSIFSSFLADGVGRVVIFNGDSPHLPSAELERAFTLLDCCDLVVGPTTDGGFYLVGGSVAHPGLFESTRMGTQTALEALLARASEHGLRVEMTAPWYDVDDSDDLARLALDLQNAPASARQTAALLAQWRLV